VISIVSLYTIEAELPFLGLSLPYLHRPRASFIGIKNTQEIGPRKKT
jgi:hypothetical protein